MRLRPVAIGVCGLLAAAAVLSVPSLVYAQGSGVVVDARGVLRTKTFSDPDGRLTRQRIAAAKATLAPEITRFSDFRLISLNRLEDAIRQRGGVPTDEMQNLAGLLRPSLRVASTRIAATSLSPARPRAGSRIRPTESSA